MSVNTYLTDISGSLVLDDAEERSIVTSIGTLSARLTAHFGSEVVQQYQFGSSTRGTILPRKADSESDIDYMVVFDIASGKVKPQSYLDRLKRFATAKYSTSDIAQSHPTVVLSLNHIRFELVPAVYEYGYQIPSPLKSWSEWVYTDPSKSQQQLQEANKNNGYQIKPLVRLIKYWNECNGRPYTSFSLEEHIVGRFFWNCSTLKEYFYSFWNGFSYSYDAPQYLKEKVDVAKRRVTDARQYESLGVGGLAEAEIKKVIKPL